VQETLLHLILGLNGLGSPLGIETAILHRSIDDSAGQLDQHVRTKKPHPTHGPDLSRPYVFSR